MAQGWRRTPVAPTSVAVAAEKGAESSGHRDASKYFADPTDMSTVPRLVRKILVRATAKAKRGEHADLLVSTGGPSPRQFQALAALYLFASRTERNRQHDQHTSDPRSPWSALPAWRLLPGHQPRAEAGEG